MNQNLKLTTGSTAVFIKLFIIILLNAVLLGCVSEQLGARRSSAVSSAFIEIIESVQREDYVSAYMALNNIKNMQAAGELSVRDEVVMWRLSSQIEQVQENYAGAIQNSKEILKLQGISSKSRLDTLVNLGNLNYCIVLNKNMI